MSATDWGHTATGTVWHPLDEHGWARCGARIAYRAGTSEPAGRKCRSCVKPGGRQEIEALTPDQEARMDEWRQRWLRIGLSTEPADREQAVQGVRAAYARAGLDPPRIIIWLDSPLAGCIASYMLAQVGAQVRDQVRAAGYGQHDAGWLSLYSFFADVLGLPIDVKGLAQVAAASGWWWPRTGSVVLTERPKELYRDDWGRLHNPSGPALLYPDGFAVYAVGGTRVPGLIIESPEKITPQLINGEANLEIRRIMIDQFGPDSYMRSRGGLRVHSDDWGELWRIDRYYAETGEPLVMLKVVNSTPNPDGTLRDYWLQVPPGVGTAHEAVAWTFGMSPKQYDPVLQS